MADGGEAHGIGCPVVTANPLVAGPVDRPTDPWAGVWIAEDIELIAQGVRGGSWIDASLGAVGAGLDGLALVSDPVGTLLQYGVSWIIEHVRPLTRALDWLAGDPATIAAHAQTLRNVARSLRDDAAELDRAARRDVADWTGTAADAYRTWANQQRDAVDNLAKAADVLAAITEGAGALVGTVRMIVRDAIATCVSRLITYAAEEALSLAFATPLVVEQVTTLVAAWAAKIARWLRALLASLRRLITSAHRLAELVEILKRSLGRLFGRGRGGPGSPRPEAARRPRGVADSVLDAVPEHRRRVAEHWRRWGEPVERDRSRVNEDGSWDGPGGAHLAAGQRSAALAGLAGRVEAEPRITADLNDVVTAGPGMLVGLEHRLKGDDRIL